MSKFRYTGGPTPYPPLASVGEPSGSHWHMVGLETACKGVFGVGKGVNLQVNWAYL